MLFTGFAALEHVLGPDRGKTAAGHPTLAYRVPIWAYIAAQLAAILWGIAMASETTTAGTIAQPRHFDRRRGGGLRHARGARDDP